MKASLRMSPPANDNGRAPLRVVCSACGKHVRPQVAGRFMHRNASGDPCRGGAPRRMRPNGTVLTWQRLLEHAKGGGVLTPCEVARAFKCKGPYASHRLMYHTRRGRLQRVAHGRYALAGDKASYARAVQSSGRLLPLHQGLTMRQWSERSGISYETIISRLGRGWPLHRAVAEPVRVSPPIYQGVTLTQWARRLGVAPSTLRDRLRNGWPVAVAVSTPVRRSKCGSA